MSLNPLTYQPHSNSSKEPPSLQLFEFSCDSSFSFVIGQFQWTSSRTHLLGWNVWQKPKYKFCVIVLITHVSTLLRWDVKWFNFCQPTLLDQQCVSIWPQPFSANCFIEVHMVNMVKESKFNWCSSHKLCKYAELLQFSLKEDLVNNGYSLFAEEVISKPPNMHRSLLILPVQRRGGWDDPPKVFWP